MLWEFELTACFQICVAVHHKSLQQVWPCSGFSKVPFGPLSTSNPALLNPLNQLSCPTGAVTHPSQKPTDLHMVLICVRYWSHRAGYHKSNPTPAERVDESLWQCQKMADDWLRDLRCSKKQLSAAARGDRRLWRPRSSMATARYSRLNVAAALHVSSSVQTQLGVKQEPLWSKMEATVFNHCRI